MKRIIVSERASKIIYTLILLLIIVFFCYVYFIHGDEDVIEEAAWSCGITGTWALAGLLGVRRTTSKDEEYYGEHYHKIIDGAFVNDEKNYSKLIQAIYYYDHDNYELAASFLDKLLKVCRTDRDYCAILILKAHIRRELKEFDVAINLYEHALRHEPKNIIALSWMRVCYQEVKDFEKVIETCKKELEIDPYNEGTIYVLSACYAMNEEKENAIKYFDIYQQCDVTESDVEKLRSILNSLGIYV